MQKLKLRLDLTVDFECEGGPEAREGVIVALRKRLRKAALSVVASSALNDYVGASMDDYEIKVEDITPPPVGIDEFVASMEGAFDAEETFRQMCLETDGSMWHRVALALVKPVCQLEVNDNSAFRQGLNDYADGMVKDGQWVTFDLGNSYFPDEEIRRAIEEFEDNGREFARELREKLCRFLPLNR